MEDDESSSAVQQLVNAAGVGRFQWTLMLVCGTTYMADAMEIMLISYLSPVLSSEWSLDALSQATLVSMVFAGELVGAFAWGIIGDCVGRKFCFTASCFLVAATGLASAFAPNFSSLVALRSVVGFGVAGIAVPFDLLMEFLPDGERGRMLTIYQYFWSLGSIFATTTAWLVLPRFSLNVGWRIYVGICSAPLWLALIVAPWVPESPEWLLAQGRAREALAVVQRMARVNGAPLADDLPRLRDGSESAAGAGAMDGDDAVSAIGSEIGGSEGPRQMAGLSNSSPHRLCTRGLRRTTFITWLIYAAFGFTYYGAIVIFNQIFLSAADRGGNSTLAPSPPAGGLPHFEYATDVIAASSEVFGTTLVLLLLEPLGRVGSQAIFYALAGVGMLLLSWEGAPFPLVVSAAFVARGSLLATSNAAWVMTPELYPSAIRVTGHQFATAANRAAAFGTPYVAAMLSLRNITLVYGVVDLVAALCPLLLPREQRVSLRRSETSHIWPQRGSSVVLVSAGSRTSGGDPLHSHAQSLLRSPSE